MKNCQRDFALQSQNHLHDMYIHDERNCNVSLYCLKALVIFFSNSAHHNLANFQKIQWVFSFLAVLGTISSVMFKKRSN